MNVEQVRVFALGTEHELDIGNQTSYQRIDGRKSYRAGGTAVRHSTEVIAVGRELLPRGRSTDYLLEVRNCSHHLKRMRFERRV
jgi:hypothetical protein